ncbi:MAG: hypothetical protein VKO65_04840 [Cyanobacteriota bacterium]|nr:hypothetical protein [Cyanobacteriota bacterium]
MTASVCCSWQAVWEAGVAKATLSLCRVVLFCSPLLFRALTPRRFSAVFGAACFGCFSQRCFSAAFLSAASQLRFSAVFLSFVCLHRFSALVQIAGGSV